MRINPRRLFAIIIPQGERLPIGNIIIIISVILGALGKPLRNPELYADASRIQAVKSLFSTASYILWVLVVIGIVIQIALKIYDLARRE